MRCDVCILSGLWLPTEAKMQKNTATIIEPDGTARQEAGDTGGLLDEFITQDELADELDVSRDTILRWRRRGAGPPCTYIGQRAMFRREAVKQWLRSLEEPADDFAA
jgi:excisionase family DNA binding protein